MSKRKPFHEVLADAFTEVMPIDIEILCRLVEKTIIPTGHDEILKAIDARLLRNDLYPATIHYLNKAKQTVLEQAVEALDL